MCIVYSRYFVGRRPCFKLVDHPSQRKVMYYLKPQPIRRIHEIGLDTRLPGIRLTRLKPNRSAVRTKNQKREQGLKKIRHERRIICRKFRLKCRSNYSWVFYTLNIFLCLLCRFTYFSQGGQLLIITLQSEFLRGWIRKIELLKNRL